MDAPDDSAAAMRRTLYWILIAVAAGNMTGRLLAVNSVDRVALESYLKKKGRDDWQQQRPFLSANDRSRWATVRSLVEHGTYAIDDIVAQPRWDTIDMVKHKDRNGQPHLYSSKPPLLATLLAGPYWVIQRLTGATLETQPYEIGRGLLFVVNVLPMLLMFVLLGRMIDRLGTTDWGRMLAMATITLGTFLTTFAVVLNNHLVAAVSVTVALYAALRIGLDGARGWGWFFLSGLAAAFTAANDLPALSFFAVIGALLLWLAPRGTLLGFVPGAAIVAAGFFGTNYVAHDSLRPPYMHRSATDPDDDWYRYTYMRGTREIPSYWNEPKGIDAGEKSQTQYALNVLVGHHGIFSLTPVWLLSFAGMIVWLARRDKRLRTLAGAIALVSLVCITFYILRPTPDRNYGGMTSGFRWVFWFAPLWVVTMLPAADWLAKARWSRGLGLLLLALSVLSASFPTWNPWTHPWLTQWMLYREWIKF